jgi:GTP cyclohydrolase I
MWPIKHKKFSHSKIEAGVELILEGLGVDLKDRNYLETPERVARMYADMFHTDDKGWATFPEDYSDFVLLKGHRLYTLCPHHLLPVELVVSLAYVPNGNVLGLSKLARICDEANRGPVLQEKFTKDLLEALVTNCPGIQGAACLVDGQHGCTKVRGIRSDAWFTTYRMEGVFKTDSQLMEKFFLLARR